MSSIIFSSSSVTVDKGRFLGMYCRSKPLKFSLLPRCQLAKGSAKYPVDPSLVFPLRGYPPYFLTGTNGTTGTALSGAGFSRLGVRDNTGTDRDRQATTGRNGQRVAYAPARVAPFFWRKCCLWATHTGQKLWNDYQQKTPACFGKRSRIGG